VVYYAEKMSKYFLTNILIITFTLNSLAQIGIKKYVKKNTFPIITIQPDSFDYSDIEAIGNAIGNSRIVMLGEASHGDALTFLAKTRLVKYLHERKGFNVLAFESDFYSLNRKWDLLQQNKLPLDSFYFTYNIHSVWTGCKACNNLFYNYIPATIKTSTPLIISGFDSQIFGHYSTKHFKNDIDSFLVSQHIPFTQKESYKKTFLPLIDSIIYYNQRDSLEQILMISFIDSIESELRISSILNDFFYQCFQNLKQTTLSRLAFQRNKDLTTGTIIRDKQMANNLNWIMNIKYPNEKIIVWAHNGHIFKNPNYYNSMGSYFTKDSSVRKTTYILGFTSKHGSFGNKYFGNSKTQDISKPERFSFENWMSEKINYGFVDFKKYNEENTIEREHFYMKCLNYENYWTDWTNGFDGIFYIKEMIPCIGFK